MPPEFTAVTEVVAEGGSITARTLLAAYASGAFPMWVSNDEHKVLAWFSPDPRAVLRAPGMQPSRSLQRSARKFSVTFDQAFIDVLDGCGDPARDRGWITDDYRQAYLDLFAAGSAHSVEVWFNRELAGGLLGIGVGGLFCADSKSHRVTDASKVAVAALSARCLSGSFAADRLIDAQWPTPHLESLGFVAISRADYVSAIPRAVAAPSPF